MGRVEVINGKQAFIQYYTRLYNGKYQLSTSDKQWTNMKHIFFDKVILQPISGRQYLLTRSNEHLCEELYLRYFLNYNKKL